MSCCTPFDYNATITNYGTDADVSTCSEEACATSYYEDLSFSLNNLEDASLGCTSGIQVIFFFSRLFFVQQKKLILFGAESYEFFDCDDL